MKAAAFLLNILYLANSRLAFEDHLSEILFGPSYDDFIDKFSVEEVIHERTKREIGALDIANHSVCYNGIGCFDTSGPWKTLTTLPNVPLVDGTKFWFWPPFWVGHPDPIVVPFENMEKAKKWLDFGFNVSLPTMMLVHGFGSNCSLSWTEDYRQTFRTKGSVNLLCLDWSKLTSLPHYLLSTANGRVAGKQTAIFFEKLEQMIGLPEENVHLMGFSLGAHIAGFVGANMKRLGRITGLDPSGPLFDGQDPALRLDPTDALFVDIIHTNTDSIVRGGFGMTDQMGHVDFYPNGGKNQVGCNGFLTGATHDLISYVEEGFKNLISPRSSGHQSDLIKWIKKHSRISRDVNFDATMNENEAGRPGEEHICNHKRVNRYFIDSIDCQFLGFACNTYEDFLAGNCWPCTDERKCCEMGYHADRKKCPWGRLFLKTRSKYPFCGHQYLLKLEATPGSVPFENFGKLAVTFIEDAYQNEEFVLSNEDYGKHMIPVDRNTLKQIVVISSSITESAQIRIDYTMVYADLPYMAVLQIDRISVMDPHGKVFSACSVYVNINQPVIVTLFSGECTPSNSELGTRNALK